MLMTATQDHQEYLPDSVANLGNPQTDIPRIAKDRKLLKEIEVAVQQIPTTHKLILGDARKLSFIEDESVHLIVTSPPYWTLKKYRDHKDQLGDMKDYDAFLRELDKVWEHCFRILVSGGRLVCVVGDVCLSRRKNDGRHTVIPLHASIQEHCRKIGYDNLAPIIWYKIANAVFEASGNGAGFLGKPYEPNAVIKNDIEFILMERKPGGYRKPTVATRVLSVISDENHKQWFQAIWSGITGASTRNHPAPFPEELAERLVRMFSFVGDTVLDPFMGTGTTTVAAAKWGRNSVGVEIDHHYFEMAEKRIGQATRSLFSHAEVRTEVKQ
jgi:DNA modification methylase